MTRKVRILDVKYNASNNELVRTQTLVKNAIVEVDAAPFKQWYLQHYGVELGKKGAVAEEKKEGEEVGCCGRRVGGAGRGRGIGMITVGAGRSVCAVLAGSSVSSLAATRSPHTTTT